MAVEDKMLAIENVSILRDGDYIIKDVSFTIRKNENWAIIGRNGSGKSFLLKIISTLIYPSEGSIEIYGRKFGETNIWELRKKIGVVSDQLQHEYTGKIKVRDVITSGFFSSIGIWENPEAWQIERVEEIMERLNLSSLADRAYETLSQGEQKKTLIGRALVFRPDLIILDEPCSGLDIPSRDDFLETLRALVRGGIHIVFVTHHIEEIIPEINKVILMEKGRIYEAGDKKDLMKTKKLRRILGAKFKLIRKNGRYWPRFY